MKKPASIQHISIPKDQEEKECGKPGPIKERENLAPERTITVGREMKTMKFCQSTESYQRM